MNQTCAHCRNPFKILSDDENFLKDISPEFNGEKYSVPPPTHCPLCRQQRRLSWRNERHLYHRKSDLSGKTIISNLSPEKPFKIYAHDEWWSDKWDGKNYGRDFDFSRSFFEQYAELQQEVPQLAVSLWNSENSDYCNYIGHTKDSYLIFGSVYSQDCYYGSPYYSTNCIDTLVVRECERCYECTDCRKLYECFYCQDCHSSRSLMYCYDLQGCNDCIGCAGLRNKQYYIFNQPFSREEYEKRKRELDLCKPEIHKHLQTQLDHLKLQIPHRYMQSNQVENVSGNYVYQSKNTYDSYYSDRCQDSKYCAQVVDLKNCYDNNYTEENELCYEYLGAYQNYKTLFSKFCNRVSDALYCDACHHSKNLFGCIGLRNSEYCVLNKQYSKEEYEDLVPRIIQHMQKTGAPHGGRSGGTSSYRRRDGAAQAERKSGFASSGECRTKRVRPSLSEAERIHQEWGEFFPTSISPFAYNETVAQEYFPLTQKEAAASGWQWFDEESKKDLYLGPQVEIPWEIKKVDNSICDQILTCEASGKLYKIIPQELEFYKSMHLPIPRKCPDQRHKDRLALRNPRQLFARKCHQCAADIQTTYSPQRPEKIYCEKCYLEAVY
ncbi:MAG: hypothetical protein AAB588_05745 [Patescibacteria group bacterium]